MKKLFSVLAATVAVAALLIPASPASAAPFAGGAECDVTLRFPNPSGSNLDCSGSAAGVYVGAGGSVKACTPLCSFNAHVNTYSEPCVASEPPLTGDAQGTLTVDGTLIANFTWKRVGVVAVLVLDNGSPSGAGVAAFVPHVPPVPTCAAPGDLPVTVAGLALNAQ